VTSPALFGCLGDRSITPGTYKWASPATEQRYVVRSRSISGIIARVATPREPLYEPFATAFESHAATSAYNAYNAHYDRPATFAEAVFLIEQIVEPRPSPGMAASHPEV
jgi:hypothetical protein